MGDESQLDVRVKWRWAAFGGLGVVAVGSLLPWVKASAGFLSVSKNGTEGDGVLTLILAVVAAIVLALWGNDRRRAVVVLIAGALAGLIALYDIVDNSGKTRTSGSVTVHASIEFGLWLTALGAVLVVVAAVALLRTSDARPAVEDAPPPPPPA